MSSEDMYASCNLKELRLLCQARGLSIQGKLKTKKWPKERGLRRRLVHEDTRNRGELPSDSESEGDDDDGGDEQPEALL